MGRAAFGNNDFRRGPVNVDVIPLERILNKRTPRFSVLSLLLLLGAAAVIVSHISVSVENARLRSANGKQQAEIFELRSEIGLLNTEDDSKIYATKLPAFNYK